MTILLILFVYFLGAIIAITWPSELMTCAFNIMGEKIENYENGKTFFSDDEHAVLIAFAIFSWFTVCILFFGTILLIYVTRKRNEFEMRNKK
jgi:hypothetical protein